MPKYMNMRNLYFPVKLNLQLFAEGDGSAGADDTGDGDDQDDDADDGADEGGEEELKYTQADLDKAVARTIAKERSKAERAAKQKKKPGSSEKEGSDGDGESEDAKARKAAEGENSRLKMKVACFEAGVGIEAVDDVAALAHAYMEADEDLDLEEAIEKVVKKYPNFKKGADDSDREDTGKTRGKAWGERQRGAGKKLTGVEEAFLKKNPGLKY